MESNKCEYKFYLDEAGKPVIEAGNPECQLIAIEALQNGDVTVKVKPKGVILDCPSCLAGPAVPGPETG